MLKCTCNILFKYLVTIVKIFNNFNSATISWFHCGGTVDYFCSVANLVELQSVVKNNHKYNNNILPIGAGSNILIRDGGFRGIVVKLAGEFLKLEKKDNQIIAGGGVLSKQLAQFAIKNNLVGAEFLDSIPGTIGGNIKMNAGCFGREIKEVLVSAEVLLDTGEIKTFSNNDFNLSYRHSDLPKNAIVLNAVFALQAAENQSQIENAKKALSEMQEYRKKNQIIGFTCGSTFANPVDEKGKKISVWKLLDDCNLRGFCVGGAMFSEKHCNFIVNDKKATANDIERLICEAKKRVKEKFDVDLHTEIQIIGDAM